MVPGWDHFRLPGLLCGRIGESAATKELFRIEKLEIVRQEQPL